MALPLAQAPGGVAWRRDDEETEDLAVPRR